MNIVIRTDASVAIGAGHVMRCLTLADTLRERGAECLFLCRRLPGHLGDLIRAHGHELAWLPDRGTQGEDAADTAALLAVDPPRDWLVVDHYRLDATWEIALRGEVSNILVIDDLADRSHECDLLLDQNYYLDAQQRYRGLLPAACEQLLGPHFSLLRDSFARARCRLGARVGAVRKLLICFGGTDPGNATAMAIKAFLAANMDGVAAEVVIGSGNPNWADLHSRYSNLPNIELRHAMDDMAEAISRADLFLGAGGSLTWERAALGLPGLTVALAENQRRLCEDIAESGAGMHLGEVAHVQLQEVVNALRVLARQPQLLRAMGLRLMDFTDGRGAERVAARLMPPQIELRSACPEDCDPIYSWRNHPLTRQFFFDSSPLDLDTHRAWFAGVLQDSSNVLLIATLHGKDVGVLRYDCRGKNADVSVYLDPARHGEGLGAALIKAGIEWLQGHKPEICRVNANILRDNTASRLAFSKAGFRETDIHFQLDLPAISPYGGELMKCSAGSWRKGGICIS